MAGTYLTRTFQYAGTRTKGYISLYWIKSSEVT